MAIISYNIQDLIDDLSSSGITFPFMSGIVPQMLGPTYTNITNSPYTRFSGSTVNQWFFSGGFVSGFTNDKLNVVRSYDAADLYNPAVINNNDNYDNYLGIFISGATVENIEIIDAITAGRLRSSGAVVTSITSSTSGIQSNTDTNNTSSGGLSY